MLAVAAALAHARGDCPRAARLAGAGERLHEAAGRTWTALESEILDLYVRPGREQVGGETFDAAWAEGRGLTFDEAIAYALAM